MIQNNKFKEALVKSAKLIVFMGIGTILLWMVYKDQPFDQIISALKKANFFWILLTMPIALLSHISRAIRWNILIDSLGYKARNINVFFSVMIMYLSNTAIPRSGEIVRCGIIKKYENIPFSKLLGTVFVERLTDFLMLVVLILITVFTQLHVFSNFFRNNEVIMNKSLTGNQVLFLFLTVSLLIILAILFFIFRKKLFHSRIMQKISNIFMNFMDGIKTVKRLKNRRAYLFHSIFIWTMYFLMIYISFKSFEFTKELNLLTGITLLVMSSIGFVVPSPGGFGSWHFMIIETLVIFGIKQQPDANAFALAVHGSMTILIVVAGFICLVLLPFFNKIQDKNNQHHPV
ncbi:MAG: lysylphosphatidylglycerol synthase transmembrane domain-containing protein [Bacteroidales bacterium]